MKPVTELKIESVTVHPDGKPPSVYTLHVAGEHSIAVKREHFLICRTPSSNHVMEIDTVPALIFHDLDAAYEALGIYEHELDGETGLRAQARSIFKTLARCKKSSLCAGNVRAMLLEYTLSMMAAGISRREVQVIMRVDGDGDE